MFATEAEYEAADEAARDLRAQLYEQGIYEDTPELQAMIAALIDHERTSSWHVGPYWFTGGVPVGEVARHTNRRDEMDRLDIRRAVTCKTCGRCFPAICVHGEPIAGTQGNDCAGYIKAGVFMGSYGSCFDLEALAIHGYVGPNVDPVCDYCVFNWMRAGRVTYLGDVRKDSEPNECREMVHRVGSIMATWR